VKTNSGYYFGIRKQLNERVISLGNEVSTWKSGRKECKTAAVVMKKVINGYQGIRIKTGIKSSGKHSHFCIRLADFHNYPGKTRKIIAICVPDFFIFG
jgi:hypothetical protein